MECAKSELSALCSGIPLSPLSPPKERDPYVPHAATRKPNLTPQEFILSVKNALKYFPTHLHTSLAPEFSHELREYGHIYMYRLVPSIEMKAYPISYYPCQTLASAAIMLMIMNNLDPRVAQYPHELVTYGGNGQVFSNWAQFYLTMNYLSKLTDKQTLSMYSGHPMGLFPSTPHAPRLVITNGMVVPNYSSKQSYEKMFALGVSMYGQMTAGSYAYIGPQGIVHGTTLTILNAARKHLQTGDLSGRVFLSSGLGGMSGAQAKAAVICGCVGVIAEVSLSAIEKRHAQGWLTMWTGDLKELSEMIDNAILQHSAVSIGYHGNVVDLWEFFVQEFESSGKCRVSLGSDQTSLHNPYGGGYIPVGYTELEALALLSSDEILFRNKVQDSLKRHVSAINKLSDGAGLFFWDYGNGFLLEAGRCGADVKSEREGDLDSNFSGQNEFRYVSYVQDIMGRIFSLGFGPFRWVCCSCLAEDLSTTDLIAAQVLKDSLSSGQLSKDKQQQYTDNLKWIEEAGKHELVVGSRARILYSDERGRVAIALAFNEAIRSGRLKGPVVLSRDHHDVGGTDSPFRETSNIYDGSRFCADMAVQNVIGCAVRGATWVSLHNGGGVGWGEVINGGFGMLLDGSDATDDKVRDMLFWDVCNGLARRSWSGTEEAFDTISGVASKDTRLDVTLPYEVDGAIDQLIKQ